MNGNAEAAAGWLRKAESDFAAAEVCIQSGKGLDAACFHCQQAAEKSLKAWLLKQGEPFPFIHDLAELIALCEKRQSGFRELLDDAAALNPFAVTMRYDADFWPDKEEAAAALEQARRIYEFVRGRWT